MIHGLVLLKLTIIVEQTLNPCIMYYVRHKGPQLGPFRAICPVTVYPIVTVCKFILVCRTFLEQKLHWGSQVRDGV